MTDLQPQSVTSKYWCRKDFQFRKAAETYHIEPPQVRGQLEEGAAGLDVEVKLCRAGGSAEPGRWRRPLGANRTMDGTDSAQRVRKYC